MQILGTVKILGILLGSFSLTLSFPLVVSFIYKDGYAETFLISMGAIFISGIACWLPGRNFRSGLRFRDGFLIVVLSWLVLSLVAAIPFMFVKEGINGFVDALFEATSGLTTTGATILPRLDNMAPSILFYRHQLQWLGGMGIVVFAVAIMPALGIGGMQLFKAETPGPMKDKKLTPRITETAKSIWLIYLGLTIACGLSYYGAGMTVFDATCHAFSTVAIGGFSTHDASLGYFQNYKIYLVATVFMILAGLNFALHFSAFRSRKLGVFLKDSEAQVYFSLLIFTVVLVAIMLLLEETYSGVTETIIHGLVQTVSIVTTTGFTTTDFSLWPTFVPILLLLLSTAGGCAGSTAGGMKVIRLMLLFKQGVREMSKLVHPNALIPVKFGGKPVSDSVLNAVWGFLALYIFSFTLLLLLLLATGLDLLSAFSAVLACLNNLGPGLGEITQNYISLSGSAKIILSFAMLLGRLELFTLLILFTPVFWKG